jgi:BRCT domain type II-containing protein
MQLVISIFGGVAALVSTYLIFFRKLQTKKNEAVVAPYKIEVPEIVTPLVIEPVIEVVVKTRKPRKTKAVGTAVKKPKKIKSSPTQS